MGQRREEILRTALEQFAAQGYEAVSVRSIAGALGMTKGALYRHYPSKGAIFQSILREMERRDAAGAAEAQVPEGTVEEMPETYAATGVDEIVAYGKAQFRYWTQDPFASAFRRMLTLEQYRSEDMGRLYHQYLAAGPMDYLTDLFMVMGIPQPRQEAAAFYGAMFLLYSVYDTGRDPAKVLSALDGALDAAGERLKMLAGSNEEQKEFNHGNGIGQEPGKDCYGDKGHSHSPGDPGRL